jgi:hypothetical protein
LPAALSFEQKSKTTRHNLAHYLYYRVRTFLQRHLALETIAMRLLSHSVVLSILCSLPFAISAPADTSATTTLVSVVIRTASPTIPLQTSNTASYSSVDIAEYDESDTTAKTGPGDLGPGRTLTNFVPAPTGPNGQVEHWYIVTYWSCVLVLPAFSPFLSTQLLLQHFTKLPILHLSGSARRPKKKIC